MRRLLSVLLLVLFGLPLISPVWASATDGDASVLACCRRSGKHHCMMSVSDRSSLKKQRPVFGSLAEGCPYSPTIPAAHLNVLAAPSAQGTFASLVSHPAGVTQSQSKWRIARDRSRQKRGPPTDLL